MAKTTKPKAAPEQDSADDGSMLEAKLENISEMLEIARRIVEALKSGATVETVTDADANIEDAMEAARELLAYKQED